MEQCDAKDCNRRFEGLVEASIREVALRESMMKEIQDIKADVKEMKEVLNTHMIEDAKTAQHIAHIEAIFVGIEAKLDNVIAEKERSKSFIDGAKWGFAGMIALIAAVVVKYQEIKAFFAAN
jgi:hypothetical protein